VATFFAEHTIRANFMTRPDRALETEIIGRAL
jgi:hypothetical protein